MPCPATLARSPGAAGHRADAALILRELLRIVTDFYSAPPASYRVCVTSPQVSVLVVEDDPGIATQLVRGLERAGYTADSVAMGAEALRRPPSDVVLLDLGLPDVDGIDVCRRLRADSNAAIIVVTARGEEADRVLALDEGADDYLVKPFGLAELLARIRAVLRRGQRTGGTGAAEVLRHGALCVDLRTRKVTISGGEVALTPKEFAILECLATDPGRLISRQEIVERAWDEHWYGPTKVLDVHLAALRRKLGDPTLIETVYGHGFRLADRPAQDAD
jgi:DNA-binding response OmpR family regulator